MHDKGDYASAEAMYREVIQMETDLLGYEHPETARAISNLAFLLYDKGETDAAIEMGREVVQLNRALFEGDHPAIARSQSNLGIWLVEEGQVAEAEPVLLDAVAMAREVYEANHPDLANSASGLALLYLDTGRPEQALAAAAEAQAVLAAALPDSHWRVAWTNAIQGAATGQLEQYEQAEELLLVSLAVLESAEGVRPFYLHKTLAYLADLYAAQGKEAEALRYRQRLAKLRGN